MRVEHAQIRRRIAAPPHGGEDRPGDVLERNVDVRKKARFSRHELEHRVVESLRVSVEESNPGKSGLRRERLDEPGEAPPIHPEVFAVTRRVLGDEDELRDALGFERLRLGDERGNRAAALHAPHLGNGAERARVVAALPDLEVGVAPPAREDARRPLVVEARREGLVGEARERRKPRGRRRGILELVEAQERVDLRDLGRQLPAVFLDHASGHDDAVDLPPLLALDLLEDRLDRLLLGTVDEAAGVDDDDSGLGVGDDLVPGLLQVAQHHLGVDEVLRASERHDADGGEFSAHGVRFQAVIRPF